MIKRSTIQSLILHNQGKMFMRGESEFLLRVWEFRRRMPRYFEKEKLIGIMISD